MVEVQSSVLHLRFYLPGGRKKPASDDDPDGPHIGFLLYARQSFSFTLPLKSNYCYPHFTDEETGCLRGYREARKLAQSPIHKKGSQDLNLGASSQIIPIRERKVENLFKALSKSSKCSSNKSRFCFHFLAITIIFDIGRCCIFSITFGLQFVALSPLSYFPVKCLMVKFTLPVLPFLIVFQIVFSSPLGTYL